MVGFDTQRVGVSAPLYVSKDDSVLLRVYNSTPGTLTDLFVRMLLPDGSIMPMSFRTAPSSDRLSNSTRFNLPEGFILTLTVTNQQGLNRRGNVYVQVFITRQGALNTDTSAVLLGDYVTSGFVPGWPGGRVISSIEGPGLLRSITGTDPAAGVEISETVPTNARWRLIAARFTFTTSVTVANRTVALVIDDGVNIYYAIVAPAAQAASVGIDYNVGALGVQPALAFFNHWLPTPPDFLLLQGHRIRTVTQNLQVGDNFAAPQLFVEEWIEE
jgi:hypothetical protein